MDKTEFLQKVYDNVGNNKLLKIINCNYLKILEKLIKILR